MNPDANYRAEAQNKFEILLDWLNPGFRLNGESTTAVCTAVPHINMDMNMDIKIDISAKI